MFPSLGELPNPGLKPRSPTLQVDSLPAEPQGKPKNPGVGSLSLLQQISPPQESNQGPCTAGGFFTNWAIREAQKRLWLKLSGSFHVFFPDSTLEVSALKVSFFGIFPPLHFEAECYRGGKISLYPLWFCGQPDVRHIKRRKAYKWFNIIKI